MLRHTWQIMTNLHISKSVCVYYVKLSEYILQKKAIFRNSWSKVKIYLFLLQFWLPLDKSTILIIFNQLPNWTQRRTANDPLKVICMWPSLINASSFIHETVHIRQSTVVASLYHIRYFIFLQKLHTRVSFTVDLVEVKPAGVGVVVAVERSAVVREFAVLKPEDSLRMLGGSPLRGDRWSSD